MHLWALKILAGTLFSIYVCAGLALGIALFTSWTGSVFARTSARVDSAQISAEAVRLVDELIDLPEELRAPPSPLAFIPDWKGTERINVLLLGIDQRDRDRAAAIPTRTDTMIIVSIDPVAKGVAIISLPRDMWVSIPGLGQQRINEAYTYGELRRLPGGGPGLLRRTIEQNFGFSVSHYASVNFPGFEEIVDTLGGIAIDVPRPVKDDAYPTANFGVERVYFAPGPQLMDGATALKYARSRHADNDLARNARQQQVLLAIRDRALGAEALARLPTLVDIGSRTVRTDFSPGELLSLGKLASEIGAERVKTLVIQPPLVRDFRGVGGAALLLPDRAGIQRAIQQVLDDSVAAAQSY
jgi:polyisoprenyl-teichoic acid--peptidoglycan teichoic acid transferase